MVDGVNGQRLDDDSTPAPTVSLSRAVTERLRAHLHALYGAAAANDAHQRLCERLERFLGSHPRPARPELFDQRDVMVIAYGDMVRAEGQAPLDTLREFLDDHFGDLVSGVHLLPIHPSTSDDGFAVADYDAVAPELGDWADVAAYRPRYDLMLDAVVNHVSASHPWVRGWAGGDPAYADFVIEADPQVDLSRVTRPRTAPVRTPMETADGRRHVWTTFSADQVDLNFANPEVLLAVTDVLLHYLEVGATRLRLDAIAFLWKEIGTSCIHLPQTHEVVRLWRTIVDAVAPGTLIVTETNVPQDENLRYFGNASDQAHLVYQFPLAPLVLHAFHRQDARTLRLWLAQQSAPGPETTFLNFLGCHDGIGLRPVEGILPQQELFDLVTRIQAHGGGVSLRAHPDGSASPYELNAVYFDALSNPAAGESMETQVARFMSAQALLLAVAGMPAVYFHALVGSRNWREGVATTGKLRTINRAKLDREALEAELADPLSLRRAVMDRWRPRLVARRSRAAFHPNATQRLPSVDPGLLLVDRVASDGSDRVLCVHNVTEQPATLTLDERLGLPPNTKLEALVSSLSVSTDARGGLSLRVPPYGVGWFDVPT